MRLLSFQFESDLFDSIIKSEMNKFTFKLPPKPQETLTGDNAAGSTTNTCGSESGTCVDRGDNYNLSTNHNRALGVGRFRYSGFPSTSRYSGIRGTSGAGGSGTGRLPSLTDYRIPKKNNNLGSSDWNLAKELQNQEDVLTPQRYRDAQNKKMDLWSKNNLRQVATASKPKAKMALDWNEIMKQAQVKNPEWFAYLSHEKTVANLEASENPYVPGCFKDKDELDDELQRVQMAAVSMKAEKSNKASFEKSLKPWPKQSSNQSSMFDITAKKSNLDLVQDNSPIVIDVPDSQETEDLNFAKELQDQEDFLASTSQRESRVAKSKAMENWLSQINSEIDEDAIKPKRPKKSRVSIKVQDRACPSCGVKMPYERLMNHSTTCLGGYTNNNKFNALGLCNTCGIFVLPRERTHHDCQTFMPN